MSRLVFYDKWFFGTLVQKMDFTWRYSELVTCQSVSCQVTLHPTKLKHVTNAVYLHSWFAIVLSSYHDNPMYDFKITETNRNFSMLQNILKTNLVKQYFYFLKLINLTYSKTINILNSCYKTLLIGSYFICCCSSRLKIYWWVEMYFL